MTLDELAKAVKGTRNGSWIRIPGPRHRKRDDSLGFRLDPAAPDGFRINSFAEDDPAECRAYVARLLAKVSKGGLLALEGLEQSGGKPDQAASTARVSAFWNEAQPPEGTPVERYLRARRCELPTSAASVLRFHPACPFGSERRYPAMLALMRDIATNELRGIQRTALQDDGLGKRPIREAKDSRMMFGSSTRAAVMLWPAASRTGIAEGIETALSAQRLFQIPVWSVLSAGGVAAFPVLPSIDHLTVFADYDEAGLQAARKCHWRYKKAGTAVEVRCPPNVGSDWNDHLSAEYQHAYHTKNKNQAG